MVDLKQFAELVVKRGLGLYGQERIAKMCYESGIALTDKFEVDWLEGEPAENVQKLLVKYGSQNLPAKMTAILLARQHGVPVPEELMPKKKKKRRWSLRRRKR